MPSGLPRGSFSDAAGLAGCETGLHLADQGHQVTIVEMQDRLAPESFGLELTATIRQIQQRTNIIVKTGWQCIEMSERSAKLKNAAGSEEVLTGETVVYSLGMSARKNEVESLRAAAGPATVWEAGDCVRGAKIFEAVSEGFIAAMKIV